TGEQLIKDGAQPVDVGRRTDRLVLTAGLLRGHVSRRPKNGPGACRLGWRRVLRHPGAGVEDLGQAKVRDPGRAVARYQHVAGFQVAVDDAATVSVVDCPRDCSQELESGA